MDHAYNILLIRKKRPDWQAGYLNGVGGKIEFGESVREAMSREFYEETGISIEKHNWVYVCELVNSNYDSSKVTFFTAKLDRIDYQNKTDEQLELVNYEVMSQYNLMPNLKALIELTLLRLNYNGNIHCSAISF
jgi:8-oxo-dGTP pyrophosphatase MutT (NUDIX family)